MYKYNINMKDLGFRIRQRRQQLKMSQEELGRKSGAGDKTAVSSIENGKRKQLSVHVLVQIADALDCDIDYFLGRNLKEQLPLTAEAVHDLTQIGELMQANVGHNPPLEKIEAELISHLICAIHRGWLTDSTNRQRWDVPRMVSLIWDARYRTIPPEAQMKEFAIWTSLGQSLGVNVFDFIADMRDRAHMYYDQLSENATTLSVDSESFRKVEESIKKRKADEKLKAFDAWAEQQKEENENDD